MLKLKYIASNYSIIIALALLGFTSTTQAQKYASIIVDDLGNNFNRGKAVIHFPAPVTLAILPKTKFSSSLAELAHTNKKEIMLHLPLQPIANHDHSPGTLSLHMTHQEFLSELKSNIQSVPFIKGINNHMGSLLTMHPGHMNWLMKEVSSIGDLYFVDSRTSKKSVATDIATENNVPALKRDVFLDPDYKPETIKKQFKRFIKIINRQGYAIAIAHPHPGTLQFIKDHLSELEENGIELVTVSELIKLKAGKTYVTCTGTACTGI